MNGILSIAVCDTDARYADSLVGALSERIPVEVCAASFTSAALLEQYTADHRVDIVIITESSYDPDICQTLPANLLILRETPGFAPEGAILIDRFLSREELLRAVLRQFPGTGMEGLTGRSRVRSWSVIGIYSPVRRSLQTSFALGLGQMLARDKKVLYLNFEGYSGLSGWLECEFSSDMTDLLYYYDCDPAKLSLRLPLMVHRLGDLDILPPASGPMSSYDRNGTKWVEFLQALEAASDYEIVILDLTDSLAGLLEVMEYCDRIYTCVRPDRISRAKLEEYEKWMKEHAQASVMAKSVKFSFPEFTDLPDRPDMLTHCELAAYIRSIIEEDEIGR